MWTKSLSSQSTVTARTDDDVSFSELGMSESESTAADTISTRSVTSYQSTRSGLTRQGTVFISLLFSYTKLSTVMGNVVCP